MLTANPLMITLAREARGYTQSALAEAAGVTQGALSKVENGQMVASPELVQRLSEVLNYPAQLFAESLVFRELPVSFYRKRARVGARALKAIRAQLNLMRLRLERLLRSVEIPEMRLPLINLSERRQSPEQVARELRARWHLPPGPIANLTETLENAGALVMRWHFGVKQVDAVSIYEPQDGLPPIVFVSDASPGDRLRYSVAHEAAHIILHHHLAFLDRDVEIEANRFAAEFLMPAADIRGYLKSLTLSKLASLKPYWKVSMRALLRRAEELGCVTERQRRYLWVQIGRQGITEPFPVLREEPALIREIVAFHQEPLGYSESELSELTRLSPTEFRETFGAGPSLRVVKSRERA